MFCLPNTNPVTRETLNYTPVAVGIVFIIIMAVWVLSARKWFSGPIRQIELERAGVDVGNPLAVQEAEEKGVLDGVKEE